MPRPARKPHATRICPHCDDGVDLFGRCSCEPVDGAESDHVCGPECEPDYDATDYSASNPWAWLARPTDGYGPLQDLLRWLEAGESVPLWWVVRWGAGGADPLQGAWDAPNHGEAMLEVLGRACGMSEWRWSGFGPTYAEDDRLSPEFRAAARAFERLSWNDRWPRAHVAIRAAVPRLPFGLTDLLTAARCAA